MINGNLQSFKSFTESLGEFLDESDFRVIVPEIFIILQIEPLRSEQIRLGITNSAGFLIRRLEDNLGVRRKR